MTSHICLLSGGDHELFSGSTPSGSLYQVSDLREGFGVGFGRQQFAFKASSLSPQHKQVIQKKLGRPLGHFMFSLTGLKRITFTNMFQGL